MNSDQLTLKAQQAIESGIRLAASLGNQEVTPLHLAHSILSDSENIVPEIFKKIGTDPSSLLPRVEEELNRLPKVEGAEPYTGSSFKRILDSASAIAGQFQDEYISTEHLFIAMIDGNESIARVLKASGIGKDNFLKALMEVRGTQKITDPNPEDKLQALKRYGRDLDPTGTRRQTGPGDRPRRGNPPRHAGPGPSNQEQSGSDRGSRASEKPPSWKGWP